MAQRQWLSEFIELYENEPCLWQNKSKEYHDRDRKSEAYKMLLEKMKEIDSKATIDTVKNKINSLRCTFKKEFLKFKSSQKSGSGTDDICIPKLWYYDLLQFIIDQDVPRCSRSNFLMDDEETDNNVDLDSEQDSCHTDPDARPDSSLAGDLNSNKSESETGNSASSSSPPQRSRPIKRNLNQTLTNDVLLTVQDHFKRPVQRDDRFDIFGKNVEIKLRDLAKEQRILAEGIINEALFLAEMDRLTIGHKISDSPHTQPQRPSLPRTETSSYAYIARAPINSNRSESQSILQPYFLDNGNTRTVQISILEISTPLEEVDTAVSYLSQYMQNEPSSTWRLHRPSSIVIFFITNNKSNY